MGHSAGTGSPRPVATSFIGSFADGPDDALVILRGDIDATAVRRFELPVDGLLEAGTRLLTVDTAAVAGRDPRLVEALGRTRSRLGARAGMVCATSARPWCPLARRRPR